MVVPFDAGQEIVGTVVGAATEDEVLVGATDFSTAPQTLSLLVAAVKVECR